MGHNLQRLTITRYITWHSTTWHKAPRYREIGKKSTAMKLFLFMLTVVRYPAAPLAPGSVAETLTDPRTLQQKNQFRGLPNPRLRPRIFFFREEFGIARIASFTVDSLVAAVSSSAAAVVFSATTATSGIAFPSLSSIVAFSTKALVSAAASTAALTSTNESSVTALQPPRL